MSEITHRDSFPFAQATILLAEEDLHAIEKAVSMIFRITRTATHVSSLGLSTASRNSAAICGYDFHISDKGPQLIEVNTNAGGLLASHMHPSSAEAVSAEVLAEIFRREFRDAGFTEKPLATIALCDRDPQTQFLYPEFLEYQRALSGTGIQVEIVDTRDLRLESGRLYANGVPIDLVYLRDTDFLLEDSAVQDLKDAFERRLVALTPHPHEYVALSDKRRMADFCDVSRHQEALLNPEESAFLSKIVPHSIVATPQQAEDLWSRRHSLVFKPARGFGSRQVYRGDKITRSKFADALTEGFIAQAYVPAPTVSVRTPEGDKSMKYDVRAFAYRDRVLGYTARVYDGQVTTLRSQYGGFAPVMVAP